MERLKDIVASNIRSEMGRKLMTQTDLATKLKKSLKTTNRILQGKSDLTITDLSLLSELFNKPAEYFLHNN